MLKKAAEFGKGMNIEAKDSGDLSTALSETLKAILAWHATAVAPTVSLSASNRNESAEDVYLAFFGPENRVRWDGTVKKFKLSTIKQECGIPDSLCLTGPVSYTHLDVYKRQALHFAASGELPGCHLSGM